jgi:hypothetical protein
MHKINVTHTKLDWIGKYNTDDFLASEHRAARPPI